MPSIITIAKARELGLSRYFTGDACPHAHVCERYVSNWQCVSCAKAVHAAHYAKNKKRLDEKSREWCLKNPEKSASIKKRCRDKPESKEKKKLMMGKYRDEGRMASYSKKWADANREKMNGWSRRWRQENPEMAAAQRVKWRAENPEESRSLVRNRRARIKFAEGSHTADDIRALLTRQSNRCAYCFVRLHGNHSVDHIQPISKGGRNGPENLQIVCKSCNSKKHDVDPVIFAQRIGRLL